MKRNHSFVLVLSTALSLALLSSQSRADGPAPTKEQDPDKTGVYWIDGIGTAAGSVTVGVAAHTSRARRLSAVGAQEALDVKKGEVAALRQVYSEGVDVKSQPGEQLRAIQKQINDQRRTISESKGKAAGAAASANDLKEELALRTKAVENALNNFHASQAEFGERTGVSSVVDVQSANNANNQQSGAVGGFPIGSSEASGMSAASSNVMHSSVTAGPGTFALVKSSDYHGTTLTEALKDLTARRAEKDEIVALNREAASESSKAQLLEEQIKRLDADLTAARALELQGVPTAEAVLKAAEAKANTASMKVLVGIGATVGTISAAQAICNIEGWCNSGRKSANSQTHSSPATPATSAKSAR